MEHSGRYKDPAQEVKKQQPNKNLNALTRSKNDNSKIEINTLCGTVQDGTKKLQNNSQLDNGSDRICSTSHDVSKHSVDIKNEISDTDCDNFKDDSNIPTAVTESNETLNDKRVAEFFRAVLNNRLPKNKADWPLIVLIESNQSVTISQQDFLDILIEKSAGAIATESYFAKQMVNIAICKEQQRFWYKKFKELLNYIKTVNDKLNTLAREPNKAVKHVRNVGTYVNFTENEDSATQNCPVNYRYHPYKSTRH